MRKTASFSCGYRVSAAAVRSPVHFLFMDLLHRCVYGTHRHAICLTSTGGISSLSVHGRACACSPGPDGKRDGAEHEHAGGHAHAQRVSGKCTDWCHAPSSDCGWPPRRRGGTDGRSAECVRPVEPLTGRGLCSPASPFQRNEMDFLSAIFFYLNLTVW